MVLGIIPARSGSKGIEKKNLYPLAGHPLIQYTIWVADDSELLDDYVVSTDMYELWSEIVIRRPDHLARDDTPMVPVIQHAIAEYEKRSGNHVDTVVVLQPTSPLRTWEDIDNAIKTFNLACTEKDSLYSGYYIGIKHKAEPYDKHIVKPHFQRNGAIFIAKRELINQGKLWSDNVIEFEMPKSRSIDIDDMDDMEMAEAILRYREAKA